MEGSHQLQLHSVCCLAPWTWSLEGPVAQPRCHGMHLLSALKLMKKCTLVQFLKAMIMFSNIQVCEPYLERSQDTWESFGRTIT